MHDNLRLAVVQLTSAKRHMANIEALESFAAQAAAKGCDLLALPEVAGLMNADAADARAQIVPAQADPFIAACRDAAARTGMWIHTGSTPVLASDGRYLNHSDLIDPRGEIRASYDKIHLFDAFLDGARPTGESRRYAAGATGVVVDTPWGPWGLSICYDLRFPQLYRTYAQAGARLVFVPSAFTVPTGRAHWEILLRARAIETGTWIIAPAQTGRHEDGRETWGHSLAVDPWGAVAADLGREAPGLAVIDIDFARVTAARRQIPSLAHDRAFTLTRIDAMGDVVKA